MLAIYPNAYTLRWETRRRGGSITLAQQSSAVAACPELILQPNLKSGKWNANGCLSISYTMAAIIDIEQYLLYRQQRSPVKSIKLEAVDFDADASGGENDPKLVKESWQAKP